MLYSVLVISTLADYAEDWGSWILGTRHTEWLCVFTGMQCNNNILGRQCDTLCCTHCQCVQRSGGGRWPRWHSPVVADRGRAQSTELNYPLSQFHQKVEVFAPRANHPKIVPSLGQCNHLLCAEHRNAEHILTPRIYDSSFCCSRTKWSRPKAGQKGHQIEVGAQCPNGPLHF